MGPYWTHTFSFCRTFPQTFLFLFCFPVRSDRDFTGDDRRSGDGSRLEVPRAVFGQQHQLPTVPLHRRREHRPVDESHVVDSGWLESECGKLKSRVLNRERHVLGRGPWVEGGGGRPTQLSHVSPWELCKGQITRATINFFGLQYAESLVRRWIGPGQVNMRRRQWKPESW